MLGQPTGTILPVTVYDFDGILPYKFLDESVEAVAAPHRLDDMRCKEATIIAVA